MLLSKSANYFVLSSISIFILYSCGGPAVCDDEILGNYSYNVSTSIASGIHISGGSTTDARIEKLENLEDDIIHFEVLATVIDGVTCTSGFSFIYDMQNSSVMDIEQVIFGCDTTMVWEKEILNVMLDIDPINYNDNNVSGKIIGTITDSNLKRYSINYRFAEIPICFE